MGARLRDAPRVARSATQHASRERVEPHEDAQNRIASRIYPEHVTTRDDACATSHRDANRCVTMRSHAPPLFHVGGHVPACDSLASHVKRWGIVSARSGSPMHTLFSARIKKFCASRSDSGDFLLRVLPTNRSFVVLFAGSLLLPMVGRPVFRNRREPHVVVCCRRDVMHVVVDGNALGQ